MAGEQVFLLFNTYNGASLQDSMVRNYNAWCNGMKEWLRNAPDHWKTMLANVPGRPSASGQAAGSKILQPSPASEMKGLLSKFNWEFRRPSPIKWGMLDCWTKSQSNLDPVLLLVFQSGDFDIAKDDLTHTTIWEREDVDWASWAGVGTSIGSSMLVPVSVGDSAVAAYLCRSVTTVCFPAFCYLLGTQFTAAEIEEAWLKLPLVKPGKSNRGTAGGRKKWRKEVFAGWSDGSEKAYAQ